MPLDVRLSRLLDGPLMAVWDTALCSTDPLGFPGYAGALAAAEAVSGSPESVITGHGRIEGKDVAVVAGVFGFLGGSMGVAAGERVARAFARATDLRLPVVMLLASGGARLQEGMPALVQMAKTVLASETHGRAGLLQVAVSTNPTTGGVFASYGSRADVTFAEPAATVGFAGPRVAEVVLGRPLRRGANTAESAFTAGLVDAIVPSDGQRQVIGRLLRSLVAEPARLPHHELTRGDEVEDAWAQVMAARDPARPTAHDLAAELLTDVTLLGGDRAGGRDPALAGGLGRLFGRPTGWVAVDRGRKPTASAFRFAIRVARLAERLRIPFFAMIDTPGADPSEASEQSGLAASIAAAMAALLELEVPVVSCCVGEGGSGGALALGCGDVLLMQEHAVFEVIAPEGAASILHRAVTRAPEMAGVLGLTAGALVRLGVADGVVAEEPLAMAGAVAEEIDRLASLRPLERLERRHRRWRSAGNEHLRTGSAASWE